MKPQVVSLTATNLTPIDAPDRGWCAPCGLPSLLSWLVAIEGNGKLLNDSLTTLSVCTDCGREDWT